MKRSELQRRLESEGVRPNAYDLWEDMVDESYGLRRDGQTWRVVYRERGIDRELFATATENEACDLLLGKILSDPTSTQAPGGGPQ